MAKNYRKTSKTSSFAPYLLVLRPENGFVSLDYMAIESEKSKMLQFSKSFRIFRKLFGGKINFLTVFWLKKIHWLFWRTWLNLLGHCCIPRHSLKRFKGNSEFLDVCKCRSAQAQLCKMFSVYYFIGHLGWLFTHSRYRRKRFLFQFSEDLKFLKNYCSRGKSFKNVFFSHIHPLYCTLTQNHGVSRTGKIMVRSLLCFAPVLCIVERIAQNSRILDISIRNSCFPQTFLCSQKDNVSSHVLSATSLGVFIFIDRHSSNVFDFQMFGSTPWLKLHAIFFMILDVSKHFYHDFKRLNLKFSCLNFLCCIEFSKFLSWFL